MSSESHPCPRCGYETPALCPDEPPVGTWVRDRFGASHLHLEGGWSGGPGCYPGGRWLAMWEARGPLVECGPYGASLLSAGGSV